MVEFILYLKPPLGYAHSKNVDIIIYRFDEFSLERRTLKPFYLVYDSFRDVKLQLTVLKRVSHWPREAKALLILEYPKVNGYCFKHKWRSN